MSEYYAMNSAQKLLYNLKKGILGFPKAFVSFFGNLFRGLGRFGKNLAKGIGRYLAGFAAGDLRTKGSYIIMGLGHIGRGQTARGILYLVLQILFNLYMIGFGAPILGKFFYGFFTGGTIGNVPMTEVWDENLQDFVRNTPDNSFKVLLYGILTIIVIALFLALYFSSVRQSRKLEAMKKAGLRPTDLKADVADLMDNRFHVTLLSLPMLGLFVFTVVPLITMILIAFTNYDASHEVPKNLFSWVGLQNFSNILGGNSKLSSTFMRVLGWTLTWAFFATFTNYFGGMILALLINKKGIRFKKLFRTFFVVTIAVPQFVSLMIVSKMLSYGDTMEMSGIITQMLSSLFGYELKFGVNLLQTRVCIILVNMWIGIPYSMLICTGILMNIPADLYESARIDGAGPVRAFFKITLPYMLFVTGPYLITQFIGNINNFNVIYLLTGGAPGDLTKYSSGAQGTDLLITWLYNLSFGNNRDYKLASVIGILVFVISAVFSLLVYNRSAAVKKEDEFQ